MKKKYFWVLQVKFNVWFSLATLNLGCMIH